MKKLKGKLVFITGAASGIGRACAKEFAREGSNLLLTDINAENLGHAAEECRQLGVKVDTIVADISKKDEIDRLAKEALQKVGNIDVLYNNAGVMYLGSAKDMTDEDWNWIVDINMWGPVRLTHALLPHFTQRRSGHIVTTASMAGIVGIPGMAAYSLTKFAMVGFSEALRAELAGQGIDVSVVCPHVVESGITETGHYSSANAEKTAKQGMKSGMPYPTHKAAKEIVTGIKKNKGIIPVARGAKSTWALKRLSPEAMHRFNKLLWDRGGGRMS